MDMPQETRLKFKQFPAGAKGICFAFQKKDATIPIAGALIFVFGCGKGVPDDDCIFEPELCMVLRTVRPTRRGKVSRPLQIHSVSLQL